jgi:osmotically-inducible protein OsmY
MGRTKGIREAVEFELAFDPLAEDADIRVRNAGGLIGVRNIKNEIKISSDADPIDVTLNVQDALYRYSLIPDDSDVLIETDDHTVTLIGHVRTWAEHDAVLGAAWMARGLRCR